MEFNDKEKSKITTCINWYIRDGMDIKENYIDILDKLKNPDHYKMCDLKGEYVKNLIYDKQSNCNVCKNCLELLKKFR